MFGKAKNWDRLIWPFLALLLLVLSCNMPGWGDEVAPTPESTSESLGVLAVVDTPTPAPLEETDTEDVGKGEESGQDQPESPESTVEEEAVQPDADPCSPLPSSTGPTITVDSEADLRDQAFSADPGTTILIAPGTYELQDTVQIINSNITLRSTTGIRSDVILDGGGMITGQTHVILIEADDITIADLTIRNGGEHGVSVQGVDRPILYNLHILDTGYQLVKINPVGDGSEDGLLACSRLEYTTTSPEEYTNGISAHNAHRWTVRDNQWYRIRTPGNTPVPTILFWSGSSDTIVERNLLVDCYQGIAFGNSSHESDDHFGGVVRNNFIFASLPHDSVVEMVHATGWLVAHNTALLLNPNNLDWGMEARFSDTSGTFAYNLTNLRIWYNRDGATTTMTSNMENLLGDWLRDAANGDLHLVSDSVPPVNAASPLPNVSTDFDMNPRPQGDAPDVGADEFTLYQILMPVLE